MLSPSAIENSVHRLLWLERERKRAAEIAATMPDTVPEIVAMALSLARLAAQRAIENG